MSARSFPEWLPSRVADALSNPPDQFGGGRGFLEKAQLQSEPPDEKNGHKSRLWEESAPLRETVQELAAGSRLRAYWEGPAGEFFERRPSAIWWLADAVTVVKTSGAWLSPLEPSFTAQVRAQMLGQSALRRKLRALTRWADEGRRLVRDSDLELVVDRGTGWLAAWQLRQEGPEELAEGAKVGVKLSDALDALVAYVGHLQEGVPQRLKGDTKQQQTTRMLLALTRWHRDLAGLSERDADRCAEQLTRAVLNVSLPDRAARNTRRRH